MIRLQLNSPQKHICDEFDSDFGSDCSSHRIFLLTHSWMQQRANGPCVLSFLSTHVRVPVWTMFGANVQVCRQVGQSQVVEWMGGQVGRNRWAYEGVREKESEDTRLLKNWQEQTEIDNKPRNQSTKPGSRPSGSNSNNTVFTAAPFSNDSVCRF